VAALVGGGVAPVVAESESGLPPSIREIAATRVRYGYRRIHAAAASGRVAGESEAGLSAVPRDGPAIAEQDAEAEG
jgi:hypothetical protein